MIKKYCIIVLLTALLLTACSQQQAKIDRNTKETTAATELIPTEIQKDTESIPTEAETTIPPTVADDLNYYEMYQKVKEDYNSSKKTDSSWGFGIYSKAGDQFAKEWKSTDGKISFVLDMELGPFSHYSSPVELPPKYTVNGIDYQNTELQLNPNISYEELSFCLMKWSPEGQCTIILSGPFEYDHDEQSFTVTVGSDILYRPNVPDANSEDTDKMAIEEWNEKYGDPDVPYYHEGEKVTFKMVR